MPTARETTPARDARGADFRFNPVGSTPKSQKSTTVNQNRSDRDRTRAADPVDVEGWANHFRQHCSVPPDLDPLAFVRKHVPSSVSYPFSSISLNLNVPLGKAENEIYKDLIAALTLLVARFPKKLKPTFLKTSTKKFASLAESEHPTRPDVTIPHLYLGAGVDPGIWQWDLVASVIEFKPQASQDPVDGDVRKSSKDSSETFAQLAKNGRNLLMGNFSCFSFVLGIYGHMVRIFRFDRAGVIVSNAFSFVSSPHILGEFFWRFVHPEHLGGVVGLDPTLSRPTKREERAMLEHIRQLNLEISVDQILRRGRWIQASMFLPPEAQSPLPKKAVSPDTDPLPTQTASHPVRCFTVGPPLSHSFNLFSRATVVWKVLIEGQGHKLFVLKDSWRELCRDAEVHFYQHIENHAGEAGWKGIAKCEGSIELGKSIQEETGHITCSAALRGKPKNDRTHMRTLTSPVGRKLTEFTSTRQLIYALRTAIEGHGLACGAGVLHRDISSGNVLFSDEPCLEGFLHDFDYSAVISASDNAGKEESILKDMTGTWQFMAREVLLGKIHERKHDLESFYWLLIWVLLRHTRHNQLSLRARTLFDNLEKDAAASAKTEWLSYSGLRIIDNEPLTWLVGDLRRRFRFQQSEDPDVEPIAVTHDSFLAAIDQALRRTDWPQGDRAIPLEPYDTSRERKARAKNITTNSSSALASGSIRRYPDLASGSTRPTSDSDPASGSTQPTLASGLAPEGIKPTLASGPASGSTKRRLSADMEPGPDLNAPVASIKRRLNPDQSLDWKSVPAAGKKPTRTNSRRALQKK